MNYKYCVGMKEYILTANEHAQCVEQIHAKNGKGLLVLRGGDLIFKMENIRSVNKTAEVLEGESEMKYIPAPVEEPRTPGKWTGMSDWAKKQSWWPKKPENPLGIND